MVDKSERMQSKVGGLPGKLGAETLTPEEQRRRFEVLARAAGCDERSTARFEQAVKVVVRHKPREVENIS